MSSPFTSNIETAFIVSAIFSAFSASCVLATFLLFPIMRTRYFMDMIIAISICDLIAAAVSAFGFPDDSSPLCPIQSALNVYFFKASWCWSTMLAHQLYSIATKRKLGFSSNHRHLICWLVPLVTTLLPLTTNGYGRNDDSDPIGWCYLKGNPVSLEAWFSISFALLMFCCVAVMMYYAFKTYSLYHSLGDNRRDLRATIEAISLYPVGMVICWVPNLILSLLINDPSISGSTIAIYCDNIFSILASQNGTMTALVFFMMSKESQFRWSQLLRCRTNTKISTSIDSSSGAVPIVMDPDEYFNDPAWLTEARSAVRASRTEEFMNDAFSTESGRMPGSDGSTPSSPSNSVSSASGSVASFYPLRSSRTTDITNPIPISANGSGARRPSTTLDGKPLSSLSNIMMSEGFAAMVGSPDSSAGWERYPSRDIQMSTASRTTSSARSISTASASSSTAASSAPTLGILNDQNGNGSKRTNRFWKAADVIIEEDRVSDQT
jgi:hypothetical protein